jgi:hypothetical protein
MIRKQIIFCGYFLTIKKDKIDFIYQLTKNYLLRKTPNSNRKLEIFRIKKEKMNLKIARKYLNYL